MKKIPLKQPIVLHISNVDLKILTAFATSQGYTLDKAISGIIREWCDQQVASRKG